MHHVYLLIIYNNINKYKNLLSINCLVFQNNNKIYGIKIESSHEL
jgi:hypothetical protein